MTRKSRIVEDLSKKRWWIYKLYPKDMWTFMIETGCDITKFKEFDNFLHRNKYILVNITYDNKWNPNYWPYFLGGTYKKRESRHVRNARLNDKIRKLSIIFIIILVIIISYIYFR